MKITVLLFGNLAEIAGSDKIILENTVTTEELLNHLITKFPEIKNSVFRIAVNQTIIDKNTLLKQDDEVALLPPFAGG